MKKKLTVKQRNSELDQRKASLAGPYKNCKLRTRPLVREGIQHQQTRKYLKLIKKNNNKKNWS
jgi:hypothetical protein